jgi:hypothetical protein
VAVVVVDQAEAAFAFGGFGSVGTFAAPGRQRAGGLAGRGFDPPRKVFDPHPEDGRVAGDPAGALGELGGEVRV